MTNKPSFKLIASSTFIITALICGVNFSHADNSTLTSFSEYDESSKQEKELSVLFTHDIHSNLNGLAKAKTIIDNVKKSCPNTIVVDGGDFSMGTLYETVFKTDAAELLALGHLGYDATTIGNHEFDYGVKNLNNMFLAALNTKKYLPTVLMSNVNWNKSTGTDTKNLKGTLEKLGPKDYKIIDKGDIKIAVFGVMGPTSATYSSRNTGMIFDDYIKKSKEIVANIKKNENPDLILCLSHSGTSKDNSISEDYILAKKVPDIDIIISAHSHSLLRKPIVVGKTIIGSVGSNAKRIGKIDLKISGDKHKIVDILNYQTTKLDSNVAWDKEIFSYIKSKKENVQTKFLSNYGYTFDQTIANNPYRFTPYVNIESDTQEYPLGNIVADSFIYAVKKAEGENYERIDVSFLPSHSIRASFNRGDITVSDAFKVCSLGKGPDDISGYPLISAYLTGLELRTLAEMDASISSLIPSVQLMMSGVTYSYNPNRMIMDRVTNAKFHPVPGMYTEIDNKKLYRVVTSIHSVQLLKEIKEKTYGLISIKPKDKDGKEIKDINKHIVYNEQGEIKEWLALTNYLESFKKIDGTPTIPAYYKDVKGREIVYDDKSLMSRIKNPNRFTILFGGLVVSGSILLLLASIFTGRKIYKIIKKREENE